MTQAEKRKNIYDIIHSKMYNKEISKKEWFAFQKELSKLLKDYADAPQEKVIIKEKIIYKKPKEDNYWGI